MMTLALLVGLWSTTCIQTQISPDMQGYAIDSYEFTESGDFRFTRNWYGDTNCEIEMGKSVEEGTLKIGKKMSGMFISQDTFEADFTTAQGTDLGAVSLKNEETLKIARSFKGSNFRNSMLGLFDFKKQ